VSIKAQLKKVHIFKKKKNKKQNQDNPIPAHNTTTASSEIDKGRPMRKLLKFQFENTKYS